MGRETMKLSQFWLRVLVLCVMGFGMTGCLKDEDEVPMDPCMAGDTRSADDDCNTCVCSRRCNISIKIALYVSDCFYTTDSDIAICSYTFCAIVVSV